MYIYVCICVCALCSQYLDVGGHGIEEESLVAVQVRDLWWHDAGCVCACVRRLAGMGAGRQAGRLQGQVHPPTHQPWKYAHTRMMDWIGWVVPTLLLHVLHNDTGEKPPPHPKPQKRRPQGLPLLRRHIHVYTTSDTDREKSLFPLPGSPPRPNPP